MAEKERAQRLLEIYNRMDARSHVVHDGKKFKKSDILQVRLIFVTQEGKNFLPTGFASSDFLLTGSAGNMFFFVTGGSKAVV